jgi:hypothetical protein
MFELYYIFSRLLLLYNPVLTWFAAFDRETKFVIIAF